MANVEGDSVGIACKNKECAVFIGFSELSRELDVLLVDQDAVKFIRSCLMCDSKDGFVEISHTGYHTQYLDEGEVCKYCNEK